ncbi:ABC transporter substrate-binding protein [Pseudothauera nasutitermitis]|uniref:ABC transporter substrate-binding protein n=1 Tax=Pseudothauera nasutitermitis TaxID=2565930 RepID=A0A4V3WC20_9RHOO|nr:ABC transporter substrate-binding protein [Pseudothauera nasutitermitis]THF65425.1 ABC transporter substrate-binding protein [Pseudothauera nasutitermitis]
MGAGRFSVALRAGLIGLLSALSLGASPAAAEVAVTDQAGRRVVLAQPAQRIVLTDTTDFISLALIDDRPAQRLVAWNRWRLDADTLGALRAADPAFDDILQLSVDDPNNFPLERVIALQPDLVVLHPRFNAAEQLIRRLEAAGIGVAVLRLTPSFRTAEPLEGLQQLGVLIGRSEQAEAYVRFFQARLERIRERAATVRQRPTVLLEPHAGSAACCSSVGRGESIGDLVTHAGGRHIGEDVLPGMFGQLSLEYVLDQAPEVYIGVGGAYLAERGGLVLGVRTTPDAAQASLGRALARKGMSGVRAVEDGRAHGIWFPLTGGLSIVALEVVAKWVLPELYADIDPQATLDEINTRFLATPLRGTFWTNAPGQPAGFPAPARSTR